jgi:hypothetical protein
MPDLGSRLFASTLAACAAATCLFFPAKQGLCAQVLGHSTLNATGADGDAGRVKDKAEVTFIGYQSLPGNRGIVFVELTDAVAVEVSRSGQVIEYKLVGAKVPLKNNRNPLILRDFSSSALTVRLVPDKPARGAKRHGKQAASVRLVITLRGNVAPSHRMVPRGNGAVLEVELPPLPADQR